MRKFSDFTESDDRTLKISSNRKLCFIRNSKFSAVFAVKNEGPFQFFDTGDLVIDFFDIEPDAAAVGRNIMFQQISANEFFRSKIFRRIKVITANPVRLQFAVDPGNAVTVAVEQLGLIAAGTESSCSINFTARVQHHRNAVKCDDVGSDVVVVMGFAVVTAFERDRHGTSRHLPHNKASGVREGGIWSIIFDLCGRVIRRISEPQRDAGYALSEGDLVFGIPVVGYKLPDGSYLENTQLEPDIHVLNAPETVVNGEDTQLRKRT